MDGLKIQLAIGNSHRSHYKNVLANRSVPLLFIVVCFVVVANIKCDHVASTNADQSLMATDYDKEQNMKDKKAIEMRPKKLESGQKGLNDPLSFLREIYLDNNSKITTLYTAPSAESVQKFHPNGRYGRRSVNTFAEPLSTRVEFGKLRVADDRSANGMLKTLLHNYNKQLQQVDNQPATLESNEPIWTSQADNTLTMDTNLELNKLLKCNFTGISNLYWCESGGN